MTRKVKLNNDDEDVNILMQAEPVYKMSNYQHKFKFFLSGEICGPEPYYNLLNTLDMAGDEDIVEIHVNSPGGQVYTAVQICNAMENSEATTRIVLSPFAASAATMPIMVADEVVVMPNSHIMMHPARYGTWGDMSTVKSFVDYHDKALRETLGYYYRGFLNEEELVDMIDNSRELWYSGTEVIERLKKKLNPQQEVVNEESGKKKTRKSRNATPKP